MTHINALKKLALKQGKPTNFIVFNPTNITYFTNFSGAAALYIPEEGKSTLYVSPVNFEQAQDEVKDFTVEPLKRGENLMEKIAKQSSAKKFSVDTLPIERWRSLAKAAGGEANLEPIGNLISEIRKVKNDEEIALIREACKIADIGAKTAKETLKAGMTEKEAAAEVEYAMRKAGSDATAFDTIIASGYCSAYPHGTSVLGRKIRDGDLVVVDLGATVKFYRSDITRTFIVGQLSDKQKRLYETVKLAHQRGFAAVKPKVAACDVDKAARSVIEEAKFGPFFVHNLGHGVGLEVHEAPILSPDSKDILEAGNVVTVEPGIYLPGFSGVRIEDTVLVTKDGAEKLTTAPYLM